MKCSMWLLEQLRGADADISSVLATSRSFTFRGWPRHAIELWFSCFGKVDAARFLPLHDEGGRLLEKRLTPR